MTRRAAHPPGLVTWVPVEGLLARFTAMSRQRRHSLADVMALGEPALFDDFGERLLFADGQLLDALVAERSSDGVLQAPRLPASIVATGVGLEFGWRHGSTCRCRACVTSAP